MTPRHRDDRNEGDNEMNKHLTSYRSASAALALAAIALVSACGGSDAATGETEAAVSSPASEEAVTETATDVPETEPQATPTGEDTAAATTAPTNEAGADPDDEQTGIEETPAPGVTQGQMIATCAFENPAPDPETGRISASQGCVVADDGSLPIDPAQDLVIEFLKPPTAENDPILGTSEIGHVYGGYIYLGGTGRLVSAVPGAGDYLGETIHMVGYSPGSGELTFDWYVGDGPQPFGATGDFDETVEVGMQCEMTDPPADAASGVTSIETCTYTSDDQRLVLGPTTAEVTLIDVGTAGDATGSIYYYTARTDTGVVRGGLIDADGTRRWAGIVDGLGEITGTVHEVGWAETDESGVTTGVMTLSFDLGTS